MTSLRQIEANRRNARLSTGPVTKQGKRRSRQNAVRHGLTAETVIDALEDAEDYAAFQMAVTTEYDARTAVERELVLRLASLLWRLRRATAIETGLFKLHALHLLQFRQRRNVHQVRPENVEAMSANDDGDENDNRSHQAKRNAVVNVRCATFPPQEEHGSDDLTRSFVRITNLPTYPLDRLSRYEAALWRQAVQILLTLRCRRGRRRW
jgi:hypothetical protein